MADNPPPSEKQDEKTEDKPKPPRRFGVSYAIATIATEDGTLTENRLRLRSAAIFILLCVAVATSSVFSSSPYKFAILCLIVVLAFFIVWQFFRRPVVATPVDVKAVRRFSRFLLIILSFSVTGLFFALYPVVLHKIAPPFFLRETAVEDATAHFQNLGVFLRTTTDAEREVTFRDYAKTLTEGLRLRLFKTDSDIVSAALANPVASAPSFSSFVKNYKSKYFGIETVSVEILQPPSWRPLETSDVGHEQILLAIISYQGTFFSNELIREVPKPSINQTSQDLSSLLKGEGRLDEMLQKYFVQPLTGNDFQIIGKMPCENVFQENFVDSVADRLNRTNRFSDILDEKYVKGRETTFLSIRMQRDKGWFSRWKVDEIASWGAKRQFINPSK